MRNRILSKLSLFLCLALVCNACIKDVDFEQAENLSITPALEASVIHFDEPAVTFLDENGVELTVIRDSVNIEIFSDPFVVDNLIKADFLFEAVNTINRAYVAEIEFFDDQFMLVHEFEFGVTESLNGEDIIVEYVEVFEGLELESLKATTNLVLTITLLPSSDGSILDETSPGNLKLRSKASFYFDIMTSE